MNSGVVFLTGRVENNRGGMIMVLIYDDVT